jgi:hypothetical protein
LCALMLTMTSLMLPIFPPVKVLLRECGVTQGRPPAAFHKASAGHERQEQQEQRASLPL